MSFPPKKSRPSGDAPSGRRPGEGRPSPTRNRERRDATPAPIQSWKVTGSGGASPARRAALQMLTTLRQPTGGNMEEWLEDARSRGEISATDAGLAREIARGVCRHRSWLLQVLERYLKHPLPEKAFHVKEALLIGMYQAIYLDRIPSHSIVDESVRLVASFRTEEGYRGLVNAILRRVTSADKESLLPNAETPWLLRHSVPDWLASEGGQIYSKGELEAFFAASNVGAPLHLRPTKIWEGSEVELEERLRAEVVDITHQVPELEQGHLLKECLRLRGRGIAPEHLPSFRRGLVTAEDEAGMVVGHLAGIQPGWSVLDVCSAPGGKISHLLDLAGRKTKRAVACDVSERKLHRLRETLTRLGLSELVETRLAPEALADPKLSEQFDLVLVDAPCSGLGTLRRHPEIRWRRSPKDLRALAKTQADLMRQAASRVAPGGFLVYSVCTFTPMETDGVIDKFLEENSNFAAVGAPADLPFDDATLVAGVGRWRTAPHKHDCDAFFVARLRRLV